MFLSRLALAGLSISFYICNIFWPSVPLPMYPQWSVDPPSLPQFLPLLILGGLLYWFWSKRKGWGRHALLAQGYFLVILFPFTGFVATGNMGFTWVMDHFIYIPMIGLIGLSALILQRLEDHLSKAVRPYAVGVTAIIVCLLAMESHAYAKAWANPMALFTYTLQHNPDAWLAHNNLGIALAKMGKIPDAEEEFRKTLQLKPESFEGHKNMGHALAKMGHFQEAIEQYDMALTIRPDDIAVREMRTQLLTESEERPEAARRSNPSDTDAQAAQMPAP